MVFFWFLKFRTALSVGFLSVFVLGSAGAYGSGSRPYSDVIVSSVGTVIDGDSFKVDVDHWPAIVGQGITVRLAGVDTPELRGKCEKEKRLARRAKALTVSLLRNAKEVKLLNVKRGKYFRLIATVLVDGIDLGEMLVDEGVAAPYGIKPWCGS